MVRLPPRQPVAADSAGPRRAKENGDFSVVVRCAAHRRFLKNLCDVRCARWTHPSVQTLTPHVQTLTTVTGDGRHPARHPYRFVELIYKDPLIHRFIESFKDSSNCAAALIPRLFGNSIPVIRYFAPYIPSKGRRPKGRDDSFPTEFCIAAPPGQPIDARSHHKGATDANATGGKVRVRTDDRRHPVLCLCQTSLAAPATAQSK